MDYGDKYSEKLTNVESKPENIEPKLGKFSDVESSGGIESKFEKSARPIQPFEKVYKRKNKDVIVVLPLNSDTLLDEIPMPSNDFSGINLKVCVPSPKTSTLTIDLNLEYVVLNP